MKHTVLIVQNELPEAQTAAWKKWCEMKHYEDEADLPTVAMLFEFLHDCLDEKLSVILTNGIWTVTVGGEKHDSKELAEALWAVIKPRLEKVRISSGSVDPISEAYENSF